VTEDAYYKKVVELRIAGTTLRFRVAQDLFSSHEVDEGTRLLLRSLTGSNAPEFRTVLDLGCGYGAVGLTLKKLDERRSVHLVDRDALAVEYTRQNAALNAAGDVAVYGSLGYDGVTERGFDLVASNVPAKAGEPVIVHLLRAAGGYLSTTGIAAVVVIAPIAAMVAETLRAAPGIELLYERAARGHTVFHYRFADGRPEERRRSFDTGVYDRESRESNVGGLTYRIQSAYGLEYAETQRPATLLLIEAMRELVAGGAASVTIVNPGEGEAAVCAAKLFGPERMIVSDRDLLALECARANLAANGYARALDLRHEVALASAGDGAADLVAGVLREDEGVRPLELLVARAAQHLAPEGVLLLAGSSTACTRIAKHVQPMRTLRVVERRRKRGWSLLSLRRFG